MTPALRLFMTLAAASPAPAEPALPYAAWNGDHYSAPKAVVLDTPPPPLTEEPENARRVWELVPDFGIALPACRGAVAGCDGVRPGVEVGLTGLYRAVPYFAIGVTARLDVFSAGRSSDDAIQASSTFFGIAGRLYPFESGLFDPYLELAIGAGALESTGSSARQRESAHVDLAPSARVAAGLDFALNPWLRLGPTFAMSEYAAPNPTYCARGRCVSRYAGDFPLPRGATTLGFRLTVSAGERL